ncbi:MAG: hypothetical protein FIA97_14820 [Methylococcaceae bacterium]|nr:hypothetical protein [Methylococcaceae bacterium]
MNRLALFLGFLMVALAFAGCNPAKRPPNVPDTWASHRQPCGDARASRALEGSWLYEEDGYMYTLKLDEQGNGHYEWKDGRFITTCLDSGQWRGRWEQPANDREGGFEINLGQDLKEGGGRWWYTRIGEDRNLTEQGGEFQLKRIERSGQGYRPKIRLKTSRNSR